MKIRLDKYLSDMNCGTRSEVKKMIRQGLVCVDQKIIKSPEYKVDTEIQNISVQGKLLSYENIATICYTNRRESSRPPQIAEIRRCWI